MAAKVSKAAGAKTFVLGSPFEKDLPVMLNAEQIQETAQRMARVHELLEQLDKRKKQIAAELNAEKASHVAEASNLAQVIRERSRIQPVRCQEEADFKEGVAVLRRLDNGEAVAHRPLREEERQQKLGLDGKAQKPPKRSSAMEEAEAMFSRQEDGPQSPTQLGEFNGTDFVPAGEQPQEDDAAARAYQLIQDAPELPVTDGGADEPVPFGDEPGDNADGSDAEPV